MLSSLESFCKSIWNNAEPVTRNTSIATIVIRYIFSNRVTWLSARQNISADIPVIHSINGSNRADRFNSLWRIKQHKYIKTAVAITDTRSDNRKTFLYSLLWPLILGVGDNRALTFSLRSLQHSPDIRSLNNNSYSNNRNDFYHCALLIWEMDVPTIITPIINFSYTLTDLLYYLL